jgi:hypothetical protein
MLPAADCDFPPEDYPIVMEFFHPVTGEVVHKIVIEQPAPGTKAKIFIPPLSAIHGHPVAARITHPDGRVHVVPPPAVWDTTRVDTAPKD